MAGHFSLYPSLLPALRVGFFFCSPAVLRTAQLYSLYGGAHHKPTNFVLVRISLESYLRPGKKKGESQLPQDRPHLPLGPVIVLLTAIKPPVGVGGSEVQALSACFARKSPPTVSVQLSPQTQDNGVSWYQDKKIPISVSWSI
ncbi:hypothetical protein B0T17DRAFT_594320 [Bombardia bombarda]|uniref:Uncharacterized protein n=1 Tax=Bombardia bombarda TaxID=252184 RepID=A0AA39XI65_9PEZI|nr:hypothetical protein B0T17DRAFT_594320 [Bombardia bombarda]